MIARIWHGWTKPEDAKTYEEMLRKEIFPSIAERQIRGYHGAELFINENQDEVEFLTLLRFDSMDGASGICRRRWDQSGNLSKCRSAPYAYGRALAALPYRNLMSLAVELRRLLGSDAVTERYIQTLTEHSADKWFAHEGSGGGRVCAVRRRRKASFCGSLTRNRFRLRHAAVVMAT